MNVLPDLLQPDGTPDLARLFLYPREVAKLAHRSIPRFLRRHASGDVVLGLPPDVLANVLVQILHRLLAPSHDSSSCPAGRRIRAIAPASLSHLPVSRVSCRRPLAVRR